MEDEKHRNRRQALLAGLGGFATAIGIEWWIEHHDKNGEKFKDLQTHLVDRGRNVEKAIRDEDEKTINLEKHVVDIETREWLLYCGEQLVTKTQLKEYYSEKVMDIVESTQILASQLRTNPMESSLADTIRKICEAHNSEDTSICLQGVTKADITSLKHIGATVIAEVQIKTPVTELEYRECTMFEEVSLPKLFYMNDQKTTKVEELDIPKRIRVKCADSSFFFDSKGVQVLDDRNILLDLIESSATLECDTDYMSCPKKQFATKNSCHRKIYSTINGKEFIAISSTDPITDSDFTTLHSLGLHGKTRSKNDEAELTIKVYSKHPKSNIHIRCGGKENQKEYHLHKAQNPDDVTIVHVEENLG